MSAVKLTAKKPVGAPMKLALKPHTWVLGVRSMGVLNNNQAMQKSEDKKPKISKEVFLHLKCPSLPSAHRA